MLTMFRSVLFFFLLSLLSKTNTQAQFDFRLGVGGNILSKIVTYDKESYVNNMLVKTPDRMPGFGFGGNLSFSALYEITPCWKVGGVARLITGINFMEISDSPLYYSLPLMAHGQFIVPKSDFGFFVSCGFDANVFKITAEKQNTASYYHLAEPDLYRYSGKTVGIVVEAGLVVNSGKRGEWLLGYRYLFGMDSHYLGDTRGVFFSCDFSFKKKVKEDPAEFIFHYK